MTSVAPLYGPVAQDLTIVDELLNSVTNADYAPLTEMLQHVLQRRGKRLRPAIALLAGGFGAYDVERHVPLAASIELLHTATLVHDDVIDAADTRRGRPTANSSYDNAASVMLGDYMFAHAAELVARTGDIRVIRLFAETLMIMAKGELSQDISAYDAAAGNLRDYYERIDGKTASLFATAGAGGAMMAQGDEATVTALRSYGHAVGMAFQIVDDILDFTSDAETLGKPVGGDLLAGTLTLPAILLMEDNPRDNPVRRLFIEEHHDARARQLPAVLEAIADADILRRSHDVALEWRATALRTLEPLADGPHRQALEEIAAFITGRSY